MYSYARRTVCIPAHYFLATGEGHGWALEGAAAVEANSSKDKAELQHTRGQEEELCQAQDLQHKTRALISVEDASRDQSNHLIDRWSGGERRGEG